MNLHQFLAQMKTMSGTITVSDGVATLPDGASFDMKDYSSHFGPQIEKFPLYRHDGENPNGFVAEAMRTGDYEPSSGQSIYEEVRISVFAAKSDECVADLLVGLDDKGELRVLLSADGYGDEHAIAHYPMRPAGQTIEDLA